MRQGIDPLELRLDRFCTFVLGWLRSIMELPQWRAYEARLWRPPPGLVPTSGPWSDEAMQGSFMAFQGELGNG